MHLTVLNNDKEQELKIHEANLITGGLSKPSKMPGFSYGLPAKECITGSKLRKIKGSVCDKCYALKGFYTFPKVQEAEYGRLDALDNPAWIDAMITLIMNKTPMDDPYFRWHDSGDLQSTHHLEMIVEIAEKTPWINHWLPTREYGIVNQWLDSGGIIPENLVIRLSAHMIDGPVPNVSARGLQVSSVATSESVYPEANQCPAPKQNNSCGPCRSCWDKKIQWVSYHKH